MSQQHECETPILVEGAWEIGDTWVCPVCLDDWVVDNRQCMSCMRSDPPYWERVRRFDPAMPITAPRGGIQFPRHGSGDDPQ